jgi:Domain of unknown function (DUF3303)
MRAAVIYRPRQARRWSSCLPLIQELADRIQRYRDRIDSLNVFAGGGLGIADTDDSAELQRLLAENPFTIFADVEIRPVVDVDTALRNPRRHMRHGSGVERRCD